MEQDDLIQRIDELTAKLTRARQLLAGLRQKSKYLEMQYEDSRARERNNHELVSELLERQRELNVMLNRANIMLNRTQEAMALASLEFNEMAKALPEPKKAEWSERVARINELFKKSGVQDAEIDALESSNPAHPESGAGQLADDTLDGDELRRESERAFGDRRSMWDQPRREPPRVEAEPVEHEQPPATDSPRAEDDIQQEQTLPDEDDLVFPPRRKSWWQRLAS